MNVSDRLAGSMASFPEEWELDGENLRHIDSGILIVPTMVYIKKGDKIRKKKAIDIVNYKPTTDDDLSWLIDVAHSLYDDLRAEYAANPNTHFIRKMDLFDVGGTVGG